MAGPHFVSASNSGRIYPVNFRTMSSVGTEEGGWRRGEREIIVGSEVTMRGMKIEEFTKSGNKFVQMLHYCVYVGSLPVLQVCAACKLPSWFDFSIFRNTAKQPIQCQLR